MIAVEKEHTRGSLSCGMMLKSLDDYHYFKAYFDNHHTDIMSCNTLRMNTKETAISEHEDIFVAEGELFENVLYYSVLVLGVVVACGLLLEGRRFYFRWRDGKGVGELLTPLPPEQFR